MSRSRILLCAALAMWMALAGCSSKQKKPAAGAGAGGAGLGEEGMGAKGGSSLERFQKGQLGADGGGPLTDIHFDYDDFTIRAQEGEILRSNARWLEQNPNARVQIEGHCDERGSEQYNLALGAKRAQAAKDYLNTLGVASERLTTISYGEELPICPEHTDECYAQNRRAHFVVSQ